MEMEFSKIEALALRCARGEMPVYALVEALAAETGRDKAEVLFGACVNRCYARLDLKSAHHAATRGE